MPQTVALACKQNLFELKIKVKYIDKTNSGGGWKESLFATERRGGKQCSPFIKEVNGLSRVGNSFSAK